MNNSPTSVGMTAATSPVPGDLLAPSPPRLMACSLDIGEGLAIVMSMLAFPIQCTPAKAGAAATALERAVARLRGREPHAEFLPTEWIPPSPAPGAQTNG